MNHDCFSEKEKIALAFTEAASKVPQKVTPQMEKELKGLWSEEEIVEIMSVISLFGFLNRWNDTMGTSLEPDAQVQQKNTWQTGILANTNEANCSNFNYFFLYSCGSGSSEDEASITPSQPKVVDIDPMKLEH